MWKQTILGFLKPKCVKGVNKVLVFSFRQFAYEVYSVYSYLYVCKNAKLLAVNLIGYGFTIHTSKVVFCLCEMWVRRVRRVRW